MFAPVSSTTVPVTVPSEVSQVPLPIIGAVVVNDSRVADPQQERHATLVLVVLLVLVEVLVVVGQLAAGCGLQTSVRTSLSFRFGLPLAMTMSVTLLFPAFFPLFFSLTVAVNAAHAESVPFGLVIVIDAPFWTLPLIFFRVAGTHDPEGLFTQAVYLKVQDPFGVVTPS